MARQDGEAPLSLWLKCLILLAEPLWFQRIGTQILGGWTDGGAEGNRTPDLIIANDALYQLSYSPASVGRALTLAAARCNGLALLHSANARPCQRPQTAAQRPYAVDHHSWDSPCNAAAHGVCNDTPATPPSKAGCSPLYWAAHRAPCRQLGRPSPHARRLDLSRRASGRCCAFWAVASFGRFGGCL